MEEQKKENEESAEALISDVAVGGEEKKIKNLISLAILLGGLFLGSVFVDVVQLLRGDGLSSRAMRSTDVVEAEGKTWVAFNEPMVKVKVLTEESCQECKTDEVLLSLRKSIPTMIGQKVDINSEEGKKLVADFNVRTIPGFVFSDSIEKSSIFSQIQPVLEKKDNQYALDASAAGIPVGKYLELPKIMENDIKIGNPDAKVKIVEFSDYQCPFCKSFHPAVQAAIKEYGDQILYVYKHLPLDFHPQAENAALASECANEQGKFQAYSDRLFEKQEEWSKTTGTQRFKDYARQLGVNATQFNKCLDDKKYADKVAANKAEAAAFGINGTPGTFVNDEFIGGILSRDEKENIAKFKEYIDRQLAK